MTDRTLQLRKKSVLLLCFAFSPSIITYHITAPLFYEIVPVALKDGSNAKNNFPYMHNQVFMHIGDSAALTTWDKMCCLPVRLGKHNRLCS